MIERARDGYIRSSCVREPMVVTQPIVGQLGSMSFVRNSFFGLLNGTPKMNHLTWTQTNFFIVLRMCLGLFID